MQVLEIYSVLLEYFRCAELCIEELEHMSILANISFAVEVHVVGVNVNDYGKGAQNSIFWPP